MKNIIRLFIPVLIIVLLLGFSQKTAPWQELFNGKDLAGWKKLGGDAEYRIDGNMIVGIAKLGSPNSFLATKKTYDDFILEYEVLLDKRLNSGVQIRSLSKADFHNGRVHGYQIELDPSKRAWSGGIYEEGKRGWLYNLENNPDAKTAFKNRQWNAFRVEAIGYRIRTWVNGVASADLVDDMSSEGIIALQVHSISDALLAGAEVRFRNIRIIRENVQEYATSPDNSIPQVSYLTNRLSEREIAEGWELLWDGKTTKGWKGAKLDHFPEHGWSINDGELMVHKSGGGESAHGGDIVTTGKYGNFILELDFKFTKGANSGIKYFVDTELNKGTGSSIGCEYQILDDDIHPDAKQGVNGNRTLASLYDLIKADALIATPTEQSSKRVNKYQWNRARIESKDNHIAHFLNGIKVVEYERGTQMWRALVAYSKYKVWENFGELPKGQILLQDHGDEVYFKNIKIRALK